LSAPAEFHFRGAKWTIAGSQIGANLLCGPMPLSQGLSNEDQDVIGHIAAAGNQLEQYVGTKDTGTGPALKHLVFSGVK